MLIKLMLVDDHASYRESMRQALEFLGFEVVGEADNGAAAVGEALRCAPDVILMDIDMGEQQGGIAATKEILQSRPGMGIILLTGHKHYAAEGIQAGARGYVLKKAPIKDIAEAIRKVHAGNGYLHVEIQGDVIKAAQQRAEPSLTAEEQTCLRLAAAGTQNREIGLALGLSVDTVKKRWMVILEKLHAHDRTHAVALAFQRGLI